MYRRLFLTLTIVFLFNTALARNPADIRSRAIELYELRKENELYRKMLKYEKQKTDESKSKRKNKRDLQ